MGLVDRGLLHHCIAKTKIKTMVVLVVGQGNVEVF
jgi:hypothetical protein